MEVRDCILPSRHWVLCQGGLLDVDFRSCPVAVSDGQRLAYWVAEIHMILFQRRREVVLCPTVSGPLGGLTPQTSQLDLIAVIFRPVIDAVGIKRVGQDRLLLSQDRWPHRLSSQYGFAMGVDMLRVELAKAGGCQRRERESEPDREVIFDQHHDRATAEQDPSPGRWEKPVMIYRRMPPNRAAALHASYRET